MENKNMKKETELLLKIAEIGKQNKNIPPIQDIFPFRHYFNNRKE